MIRPAKMADVKAMVGLLQQAHSVSIYADMTTVREQDAQQFLAGQVQRMGDRGRCASLLWVAENEAGIVGMIVAVKGPIYFVGAHLFAQEVYFYGIKGLVDPQDMVALFRRFDTWAEQDERVLEIKTSSSDTFDWINWKDLRPFYERRGYKQSGEVFVRRLKR